MHKLNYLRNIDAFRLMIAPFLMSLTACGFYSADQSTNVDGTAEKNAAELAAAHNAAEIAAANDEGSDSDSSLGFNLDTDMDDLDIWMSTNMPDAFSDLHPADITDPETPFPYQDFYNDVDVSYFPIIPPMTVPYDAAGASLVLLAATATATPAPPPPPFVHMVPARNTWRCRMGTAKREAFNGSYISPYNIHNHNCHHAANAAVEAGMIFPGGTSMENVQKSPDNNFAELGLFSCIGLREGLQGHTVNWFRTFCDSNPKTAECHRVCISEPQDANPAKGACCFEGTPSTVYATDASKMLPEAKACIARACNIPLTNTSKVAFFSRPSRGKKGHGKYMWDVGQANEWYCARKVAAVATSADPADRTNPDNKWTTNFGSTSASCTSCCDSEGAVWSAFENDPTVSQEARDFQRQQKIDFINGCKVKCSRYGSRFGKTLALTAEKATVYSSQTDLITATVMPGDMKLRLTWSLTGGGSLSTSVSTMSTTYTAPVVTTAQSVTITATQATDSSVKATIQLSVLPPSVMVSTQPTSLLGGQTSQLSASIMPSGGEVDWTVVSGGGSIQPLVSSGSMATFTAPSVTTTTNVVVKASMRGSSSISATTSITVTPAPPPMIMISASNTSLTGGQQANLSAGVMPYTGPVQIVWTATGGGTVTPQPGSSQMAVYLAPTVTSTTQVILRASLASDPSVTATITMVIAAPPPPSLMATSSTYSVNSGGTATITAGVMPNGGNDPLSWSVMGGGSIAPSGNPNHSATFTAPTVSAATNVTIWVSLVSNPAVSIPVTISVYPTFNPFPFGVAH